MYSEDTIHDLARSGLIPQDLKVKDIGPAEKSATNVAAGVSGYMIPYFDIYGKPIQFYRVRLFEHLPKYKQLINSPNHIYFPPGFAKLFSDPNKLPKYLLLTEGEKKAACAVKNGFPCIALSGVDSWRNRTFVIPKDANIVQNKNSDLVVRLKGATQTKEKMDDTAEGFEDIIALLLKYNIPIIIAYDSDLLTGTKIDVQRAAATLGYELRFRGIPFPNIRQLKLEAPGVSDLEKVGLDDLLMHRELGPPALSMQIAKCLAKRSAFPRHPNPKEFVNKRLSKTHLTRQETQALSTAIISDLDTNGVRLRCPLDDSQYYFDRKSRRLIRVDFQLTTGFAKTDFGVKLYRDYNLSVADQRLFHWLNAQYSGEEPVVEATPENVIKLKGDNLYYQCTDGTIARVNATGIDLLDNGTDDILFESGSVVGIDVELLKAKINAMMHKDFEFKSIWYEVLKEARIAESPYDWQRKLLALLYNISPWFYRWRGTQLPLEMTIGEPGSGKSTLYELRLGILNGIPKLRNAPKDLRDWTASVASVGGMHVTDNVHMTDPKLRQELSDELCRVITEPNPYIERRKLYADNTLIQTPVRAVFAFTAVAQPFTNPDIIQRAVITDLDKGTEEVAYDADWKRHKLAEYGGREGWLAHQLVFQHKMFKAIKESWVNNYQAKYRLQNVEQLLMKAAEVYGWDGSWIAGYLEQSRDERTITTDWALEGLKQWAEEMREALTDSDLAKTGWFARDIAEWAEGHEDFSKSDLLTNPRQLGRYIAKRKNLIASTIGVVQTNIVKQNAIVYQVVPLHKPATANVGQ